MVEFKLVVGTKDGKSYQKEVKSPEADHLLKRRIQETVSGDPLGFSGYEFQITGGSDKCGFPMRKGIQHPRKKILKAATRDRNKKTRYGLLQRQTVCGEMITKIIHQVNLKVMKEGTVKLGEPEAEEAQASHEEAPVPEKNLQAPVAETQ